MRFTRGQLRRTIREAIEGNVHGDPKKERFLDIVMNALADGDTDSATSAILDSFWMDDTRPAEEDALEAQLAALAPGATQEEVEAIADQWLIDYRSGSLRPPPEEYEAQWAMGSSPSSARRKKKLGEAVLTELGDHPVYTKDDELREIGLDLESILQTAAFMQEKVDAMASRYGELTHLSTPTRELVKDIQALFNAWDKGLDNLSRSHERGWYNK